ncbi:MAG TPA: hypothetical protein VFC80_05175 [Sphaerochaeta sp.]|nr:hypothetical protein [Sphaerochaeta sp.]
MRRRSFAIALFMLLALLLASCTSTVMVRHLVPAEISLDGRRSLAIASVEVDATIPAPRYWIEGLEETNFSLITGWESTLVGNLTKYVTADLLSALSETNYFTITPPSVTDSNIHRLCRSSSSGCAILGDDEINALLFADVTYLDATERVVGRDTIERVDVYDGNGVLIGQQERPVSRDYYLIQRVTLSITYTIFDPSTGKLLYSKSYTDAKEVETKIGVRLYQVQADGAVAFRDEASYLQRVAPSLISLYKELAAKMTADLVKQLAPSWKSERVSLMAVKPKSPESKEAQSAVDSGNYRRAYTLYNQIWLQEGSGAAGYNAALLLEVMGEFDQALELSDQVYRQTGSTEAYRALLRVQEAKSQHEKAQRQISGEEINDGIITQFQYTVVE